METKQNCTLKEHKESVAITYCEQCKIYMCDQCLDHHNKLFDGHIAYDISKNNGQTFIDLCKKVNHEKKLEFFCKDHDELCCVACISKIESKGYGQHKDCNVCPIDDIIEEKKNLFNENIKFVQNLLNDLESIINEMKILLANINNNKEELKSYVQKIFTKFRNAINERENDMLSAIDKKFEDILSKEETVNKSIGLPNQVKINFEKSQSLDQYWNDNSKLSSLIYHCIKIEKDVKNINFLISEYDKCGTFHAKKINLLPGDEDITQFIQSIKAFGKLTVTIPLANIDSLILKSEEDKIKFYKLISKKLKNFNMNLLYRTSRDGVECKKFLNNIKKERNLIFLYLVGNDRIFGNYIVGFKNSGYDPNKYWCKKAFEFSLNNNNIHNISPTKIRYSTQNSPIIFENNGKNIYDEELLNESKVLGFEQNNEIIKGENTFNELEIFEINSSS